MYLIVGLIVLMNVIKELSWEWEPKKMKKMSSMKRFQKYIRRKKVRIIVCSSLPMKDWQRGSHPGSHGRTKGLVYMVVHEFEGAMFEDEIEYDGHYMGQWTVCG